MASSPSKSLPALGFLTVCEHAEHGLFGGYLVLNAGGRPLEFHCTAPVRPNRAQQILFGRTLKPFLYGEQIGQTLISKAKSSPLVVWTDVAPVLAVRPLVSVPVVLVPPPENQCGVGDGSGQGAAGQAVPGEPSAAAGVASPEGPSESSWAVHEPQSDVPAPAAERLHYFQWGQRRLAVAAQYLDDEHELRRRWGSYEDQLDVVEPFQRIREAIEEAQRTTR